MEKHALLLLPNLLGENRHHEIFLPQSVDKALSTLDGIIAESESGGRRFLSRFQTKKKTIDMPMALYNEHTPDADIDFLLEPMLKGERWGLVSDAGLPCIADPGAKLVKRARQVGIPIQAFIGPSAIFLSLMLSGLPGQRFSFLGYLDKDSEKLGRTVAKLEKESKDTGVTQIFMERPYHNRVTLETVLTSLSDNTQLCAAWELTTPDQGILSQSVAIWKKSPLPNLEKRNCIFLLNASTM